jgi:hypothetical protein
MDTRRRGDMETRRYRHGDIKQKTEAQAVFLNPFTVCSSSKRKFVVCPFVDEETNGSYPFGYGLNRLHAQKRTLSSYETCTVQEWKQNKSKSQLA